MFASTDKLFILCRVETIVVISTTTNVNPGQYLQYEIYGIVKGRGQLHDKLNTKIHLKDWV